MEKIDTGTDQLLVEKENGVATIILNRPDVRNALSTQLTPALRRMIDQMFHFHRLCLFDEHWQ